MDMEQEMNRLQGVEREFMEYLKAQCELVGADTNVEGLENPKLALACRYALANQPPPSDPHQLLDFAKCDLMNALNSIQGGRLKDAYMEAESAQRKLRLAIASK